jgi:hypothetical protein
MLLRKTYIYVSLTAVLAVKAVAIELPFKSVPEEYPSKLKWMAEFGTGAASFTLMRIALIPVQPLIENSYIRIGPLCASDAYNLGSTIMLSAATGFGTWYIGSLCKDEGSLIGALLGAGIGSTMFTTVSSIFDGWGNIHPLVSMGCRLLPPVLAFAGYQCAPRVKLKSESLGFDIRPTIGQYGAGLEACLKF